MRRALLLVAWLVIAVMLAFGGNSSLAQGDPTPTLRPVSDNEVNRVSKNLYCPVCENLPLEVCPTEACARWRDQVRELLARGYTETQVQQYFIERFGTKTVGTPADFTALFFTVILPYGLIGLFGVLIGLMLIRWRAAQAKSAPEVASDEPAPPDEADPYRAKLEQELRKRF